MQQTAITSDGVRIAYEQHGSGRPIVFVHGLGDERSLWRPLIEQLRARHRCIALDLRGHGESSGAIDYDPFGLTRDIIAVTSRLSVAAPSLVGHSLGGFAVTLYAAKHGAASVINLDQQLQLASLASSARALRARIEEGHVLEVTWAVLESLGLGDLSQETRARLRTTRAKLSKHALLGLWRPLLEDDPEVMARAVDAALAGIRAPYLAVHGGAVPDGYGGWLRARIPSAAIEIWEGAGHFPQLTMVERLAAQIDELASK